MHELPEGKRATKGKALVNYLSISPEEKVTSILAMPKELKNSKLALMMVTKQGTVKKVDAKAFHDVRRSGLIAISLHDGDELTSVQFVAPTDEMILATAKGQSIRFKESDIREMGRGAAGVRAVKLGKADSVVSTDVVKKTMVNPTFFVISSNGYGKKTALKEYKVQNRGGSGIKTMKVTAKTGDIMSARVMTDEMEEIAAISKKSQVIRVETKEIPTLGRQTQGVRIMKLRDGDFLASVTCL
jgi:DNA gyrase subunit A